MGFNFNSNKYFIYVIPIVYILWSIFLLHLYGPFYLNRIDPEFPYLLNGLGCALANFSRIGLVEHPGTPFHIITGIFIQIIYWIFGQGSIVEDVISRPELYLTGSSSILAIITTFILLWYGKLVLRYKLNILNAVLLQSTVFTSMILIELPRRYIPDRMLFIYILIFIGLCLKYIYQKNFNDRKFAIYTGILMGIGFVTKFHFLPIIVIPFIVLRNFKEKFIYIAAFIVSAFISFLPIFDKISQFRIFIVGIFTHDGLYGGGTEQVFNWQTYWRGFLNIFSQNSSFTIIIILIISLIGTIIFNKKVVKTHKKEFLFLIAILSAIFLGILMISKHYKNYYVIPIITLSGFALMLIWQFTNLLYKRKFLYVIFYVLLAFLIVVPVFKLYPGYKNEGFQNSQHQLIDNYIKNNISSSDYLFIEPSWLYGPSLEDGLVYGISYVGFRHYYYNEFERVYPNVLTYEGNNNPLRYFRMLDADNEAIFKSGKKIYIFSTPGRNADVLCNYLDSCYNHFDMVYVQDTVFRNNTTNQYIISIQQNDNWKTKINARFGFENATEDLLISDDGVYTMQGSFDRDTKKPANGQYDLEILPGQQSPDFIFNDFHQGDFIEVTIKRLRNSNDIIGNLHFYYSIPDSSNVILAEGKWVSKISPYYELLRLTAEVPKLPENAILKCRYNNSGAFDEIVDDLTLNHFSNH